MSLATTADYTGDTCKAVGVLPPTCRRRVVSSRAPSSVRGRRSRLSIRTTSPASVLGVYDRRDARGGGPRSKFPTLKFKTHEKSNSHKNRLFFLLNAYRQLSSCVFLTHFNRPSAERMSRQPVSTRVEWNGLMTSWRLDVLGSFISHLSDRVRELSSRKPAGSSSTESVRREPTSSELSVAKICTQI